MIGKVKMLHKVAPYFVAGSLLAATPVSKPRVPRAATVRTVEYSPGEVVDISTRLRYNTTIILPSGEKAVDFICGDSDQNHDGRWIINGTKETGYTYVKPTSTGAETNLTLVSDKGNTYLFMLHETRKTPPDLRVSLKIPVKPNVGPPVKMVPESEANKAKQDAEDSRAELASVRSEYESDRESWQKKAAEQVAKAKADAPGSLRFDYKFKPKKEFHVEAIAHDGAHTFIWADPSQAVALYGRFEGKPDLIQFSYSHGLYTADKVLEDGYLQIGKSKLKFRMWD